MTPDSTLWGEEQRRWISQPPAAIRVPGRMRERAPVGSGGQRGRCDGPGRPRLRLPAPRPEQPTEEAPGRPARRSPRRPPSGGRGSEKCRIASEPEGVTSREPEGVTGQRRRWSRPTPAVSLSLGRKLGPRAVPVHLRHPEMFSVLDPMLCGFRSFVLDSLLNSRRPRPAAAPGTEAHGAAPLAPAPSSAASG